MRGISYDEKNESEGVNEIIGWRKLERIVQVRRKYEVFDLICLRTIYGKNELTKEVGMVIECIKNKTVVKCQIVLDGIWRR